jgi:hypothetical protein
VVARCSQSSTEHNAGRGAWSIQTLYQLKPIGMRVKRRVLRARLRITSAASSWQDPEGAARALNIAATVLDQL